MGASMAQMRGRKIKLCQTNAGMGTAAQTHIPRQRMNILLMLVNAVVEAEVPKPGARTA